jgi:peptidoglycan/LPS O-acetylase OafA/YrhL
MWRPLNAMGAATHRTSGRTEGIDSLRGISILAVLLLHIQNRMPVPRLPAVADRALYWNGYHGVIVFFALSGFLIASTCLRRFGSLRAVKPAAFYRLRFARIAPCLLVLLAVSSGLHVLRVPGFIVEHTSLGHALFSALTFQVNRLQGQVGYLSPNWDLLWSLSIEEMFYLFFPLLCARLGYGLVPVLLAFVVAGPLTRLSLQSIGNDIWADRSYLSCMDAISIGVLVALAADRVRGAWLILAQAAGCALLLLVMVFHRQAAIAGLYRFRLDITALAIGAALMALGFHGRARPGTRLGAPLRWFGRNSYEIYLSHDFVTLACARLPFGWIFSLALSGALGAAISRWFSEPFNRALRSSPGRRPAAGVS